MKRLLLILIFLSLLVLRMPGLSNPPADYHSWRQSDTEAIAQNILENDFSSLFPQLNYDGPAPNYVQLELPVTSFIIAILYKIFGYSYMLARLVPLAFFMASAYFLYLLGLRFLGHRCAVFSLILYGIFPFNIYFSRAIMPEAAALFFQLGGFYFFLLWLEREKTVYLIASSVLISLAVTQKVPAVFILVPTAYLLFNKYHWKMFIHSGSWVLFLIAVIPPYFYFTWLAQLAQTDYVSGIAARLWPTLQKVLSEQGDGDYLRSVLPRAFTSAGLFLMLFIPVIFNKKLLPLGIWLFTMVVEAATVAAAINLDYYVIFLGPPLALLGGKVLDTAMDFKGGVLAVTIIFSLIVHEGYQELTPRYVLNSSYLLYARDIEKRTKKEDLLILGLDNPVLFNISRRKGWRANVNYQQDPAGELKGYIDQGAKYFIMIDNRIFGDEDGSYVNYLNSSYDQISPQQGITYYRLH